MFQQSLALQFCTCQPWVLVRVQLNISRSVSEGRQEFELQIRVWRKLGTMDEPVFISLFVFMRMRSPDFQSGQ